MQLYVYVTYATSFALFLVFSRVLDILNAESVSVMYLKVSRVLLITKGGGKAHLLLKGVNRAHELLPGTKSDCVIARFTSPLQRHVIHTSENLASFLRHLQWRSSYFEVHLEIDNS